MRLLATPVEMTLPRDDRLLRLVRLTAGGIAAVCGLPLDEAEDVRLVVDEICATLFEACDEEALVHVGFRMDGGSLIVDGFTTTHRSSRGNDARSALGRQILSALAESSTFAQDGDRLRVVASIALRARGVS